jgi:RND family efflux transporter MFP subunit
MIPMLACCSCSNQEQGKDAVVHSVLVVKPTLSSTTIAKSYSGVVAESKSVNAAFKTAGQISRTLVKEGDYVSQGQVIAVLDDVDYQLAAKEARIQYDQMASEMKRLEYMYQTNNLSQNDYEKSKAGLERLEVNLQNCQNRLNYCKLHAPTSGYVVKLNYEKGEMVNAGTPVVELMDNSSLEINVDLPAEAYLQRSKFLSYTASANGASYAVKLLSITPKADNNQLYSMRLAVPADARQQLTAGMNVEVTINRSDSAEANPNAVFELPLRSVFYDKNNQPCVWTLAPDSTVVATAVSIGDAVNKGNVEITAGLNGDETIVRAGVNSLLQGEKVKVIDEPETTNVGRLL